ncbi:RNA-binding protein 45-like [Cydia fagiglandana]|uniref:RNA-binding protein 45-like n=1 Tax=Cydia fagiglandana TaxID=1458189 RepID=UPI002FEE11EF
MEHRRKHGRGDDGSEDHPTYSRLFIVCEKRLSEDDFRQSFSKFGTIEDIRMPRDHNTGDPKGIVYIKFNKTSEAARALEEMNFKVLPNASRPLKVMVAANRSEIESDDQDHEKYKRLFLNIPKTSNEDVLQEDFGQYGEIESINIQRDRSSGDSKGFAYVKFRKFSEAATAFEKCDKKYRAIFAMPKGYHRRQETAFESNISSLARSSSNMRNSLVSMMNVRPDGYTSISFMCCPYLTQLHVERFFDIVPGMVKCQYFVDLVRNFGKGTVQYSNPVSAAYAVDKLNKFEYPPGLKIFVKPDNSKFEPHEQKFNNIPDAVTNLKNVMATTAKSTSPDLAQLAEAISEASKLIKMATAGMSNQTIPDSTDLNYCSVKLPSIKDLADIDSKVAKRCFLICKPQPPPLTVLRDIFCRFGDLINVYTLPNKTVGYARYASVEAANEAIKTLHGAEVCGVRMKVLPAEEKPDDDESSTKRTRYDY